MRMLAEVTGGGPLSDKTSALVRKCRRFVPSGSRNVAVTAKEIEQIGGERYKPYRLTRTPASSGWGKFRRVGRLGC